MKADIKLTEYSKGAGCGCKISPAMLEQILKTEKAFAPSAQLLVGNGTKDDAAVYDLGNGTALISTTDFFMPIVDNPLHFGRIAAANAISDVYAMGGKPILAIAILGWPVDKIDHEHARVMLDGARETCALAGIDLAGGHSIDAAEPFFGLAVNGIVQVANLKKNNTAHEGDLIFITKPIGSGILSTAQKRGVIQAEHQEVMIKHMEALNKTGERLGAMPWVHAMTDITGFGLLGHLIEIAEGSRLSAEIDYGAIPLMDGVAVYVADRIVPDATYRNWNSYSTKVQFAPGVNVMQAFNILPDPQTNGGLLLAVDPAGAAEVQQLLQEEGLLDFVKPVGRFLAKGDKVIVVK